MISSRQTGGDPVYGRVVRLLWLSLALLAAALAAPRGVQAQTSSDAVVVDAREALRKKDKSRLASARATAIAAQHPLAAWIDYWELGLRLADAQQDELDSFYARWSGSYVEDRLRNDWLLELGRRRDWRNFAIEYPRFRMNDDREVTCYALLVDQQAGKDVRDAALAAWLAQRDSDDGCALMAKELFEARQFTAVDVWRKLRWAVDANRPRAAKLAATLLGPAIAAGVGELLDHPARFITKHETGRSRNHAELTTLALARMATSDPEAAAGQLQSRWDRALPADLAAWAWAMIAKQSAIKLLPDATDQFQRAALRAGTADTDLEWPDETLAWKVRAALRADNGHPRWQQVMQAINAMSAAEQRDPAWLYWKARALQALANDSQDGDVMRESARELLSGLAGQMHFYGKLASEDLGQPVPIPSRPEPLTEVESEAAAGNSGLSRALQLIALGLRNEGVREWNFTLRGMGDRELLAAAQRACDREVWDRCINTSDRTRGEVDMAQRFPTPFRQQVQARALEIGLDAAYVYGLIRQESRFIMDARSNVGASGLMQIMPATARWTARKIGVDFTPALLVDRDTNLKLGTSYLKLVLDDFGGSQAMAAAAYNAGPSRSRRWRDGPVLEPAVWAENIPFNETRDYVKKVLSNATYYAALLGSPAPSLKARLGRAIGPRELDSPTLDKELP
jgi:soluble lytic murein transglycosylase